MHAVESLLVQAIAHRLKAEAWLEFCEARRFRGDAAARFAPPMRQRLDVTELHRRALRNLPDAIDGQPFSSVPPTCPVPLDELLNEAA